MCISTLFLFAIFIPSGSVKAVTIAFTAVVMFEMVRIESVRMRYKVGLFSNKKLLLAIAISIFLQLLVVYTPIFQPVFETTYLNVIEWIWIIVVIAVAFLIIWVKGKLFKGGRGSI